MWPSRIVTSCSPARPEAADLRGVVGSSVDHEGEAMTAYDSVSFAAGQRCGTRVAVCVARLSALDLLEGSRWWNRWRHRLMAHALLACADELELAADDAERSPRVTSAGIEAGVMEEPSARPSGGRSRARGAEPSRGADAQR
jgi:hypothetical protein